MITFRNGSGSAIQWCNSSRAIPMHLHAAMFLLATCARTHCRGLGASSMRIGFHRSPFNVQRLSDAAPHPPVPPFPTQPSVSCPIETG